MQIAMSDFTVKRSLPEGKRIVRCGCGFPKCEGWAEVWDDEPTGLRPWEAGPEFIGPLMEGPYQ